MYVCIVQIRYKKASGERKYNQPPPPPHAPFFPPPLLSLHRLSVHSTVSECMGASLLLTYPERKKVRNPPLWQQGV